MRFLREEIFDHEFYCPVGERRVEFVMSLEKSMRILSRDEVSPSPVTFRLTRNKTRQLTVLIPDLISCRTCRSETYTAITNCHDFVARHEQRCDELTERLSAIIGFFTPPSDKRELYPLVRNTYPSLPFLLRIRCIYQWTDSASSGPQSASRSLNNIMPSVRFQ
jgi:hypothetical protein